MVAFGFKDSRVYGFVFGVEGFMGLRAEGSECLRA